MTRPSKSWGARELRLDLTAVRDAADAKVDLGEVFG
jgi:hypothetical protein